MAGGRFFDTPPTRRYAKRQISWFKRDGRVHWLDMDALDNQGATDIVLKGLSGALDERRGRIG